MLNIDSKIFELFDEKLDLVLFWVTAHIPKLFVFVAGNDLINDSCNPIGDGDLGLVCRT